MPMTFPYLKAARVKLQERKNTCLRATYSSASQHVAHFLQFLVSDPIIAPLSRELHSLGEQHFPQIADAIDGDNRCLRLPTDDAQRAALYYRLLSVFADPDPSVQIPGFHMIFDPVSNRIQDHINDFFEQVLIPLYGYLDERIDEGDLLLYMLCRYQRDCGWFRCRDLAQLIAGGESSKLEGSLDKHLRQWLFREGVDYPFSTPHSSSGRADIVVWHGETPLPIEVKVFDGEHRDRGHVSQGLWQAFRYASDYGRPFGYLVLFNTTSDIIVFDHASGDVPPCVPVGDRSVFAVTVQVQPPTSTASKEHPQRTVRIPVPRG